MWGLRKSRSTQPTAAFADIHCHMLSGIDDGSKSEEESLLMAEMASHDGIGTVIVTPHQLGAFSHNAGDLIRKRTRSFSGCSAIGESLCRCSPARMSALNRA